MNTELKTKYQSQQIEINNKLEMIKAKLITHHEKFNNNSDNWGFLGDLNHINNMLDEVITFIN